MWCSADNSSWSCLWCLAASGRYLPPSITQCYSMSWPSLHPASPAWGHCWNIFQAMQHHVVYPFWDKKKKMQKTVEVWHSVQAWQRYILGPKLTMICLLQRLELQQKDKYWEIKRTTVIQCFCLRWDTCYCHDMTEKIEIREDTQENGLVDLSVCIAGLRLLTQKLLFQVFLISHTKAVIKIHASIVWNTHTHTRDDQKLRLRSPLAPVSSSPNQQS